MAHDEGGNRSDGMGQAVIRGISLGIPVAIVFLTLVVWMITDQDLADSFATALLPGVMLGGFAGGFVGLTRSM